MARARIITAAAVTCLAMTQVASAQLDDKVSSGGTGNQLWQVDANWLLNAMPTTFPNDPDRVDAAPAVIVNSIGANVSVNLAANLSLDVGATDVTVSSLTMGGTGSAVTTNITSSGGRLVFENFEQNNTVPEPDVCAFNCGAALITSQGVAGSTNTITALIGLNDVVDVTGTRNLTIAGGIEEMSGGATLSALSPNATVFITSNFATVDQTTMPEEEDVGLVLNGNQASQGSIDVIGVISGAGRMRYGTQASNPTLPLGQVILRSANTYSGRSIISRGNLVLANDNALGTADLKQEGPAQGSLETGYNLISDNDNRTIANELIFAQWQTVKGENSIKFTGRMYQTNARGWINMLPAGKTLTLAGQQYTFEYADGDMERILTFDGKGKTVVTGGIRNRWDSDIDQEIIAFDPYIGAIRMRGTGALYVDGDNMLPNSDSNFNGSIYVQGGNLHFATMGDVGGAIRVNSLAGAVGVDSGVVNNSQFFGLLNSSSNPAQDEATNPVVWDRGGLMLGNGEYGMNLDFTGAHANAADMSLAAHEGGSSYTGTITPAASTYRFGGGAGTLTLPGTNQLTGARNVEVTNGGEVSITGSNNYTNGTSIVAKYVTSLEKAAAEDTISFVDNDIIPNDQVYLGTTLTATTLADGSSASSIGSSTNAASNLYIQGSTLKYVGGPVSSNRSFTIGTGGATIDASGSGALNLTNGAALAVDIAEQRTGFINAFATGNGAADLTTIRDIPSTEDLHPGMTIMSPGLPTSGDSSGIPVGATITRIASPTDVVISANVGQFAYYEDTPITFGPAPERKLTLTGSNSGDNRLAALVGNASDGGLVGLTKNGGGRWITTGNNTYGGTTTVNAGTLMVNGNQTGTGLTTVNAGGTLGGTGALGGGLTMAAGSHFLVELTAAPVDPLAINGNVDLSAINNFLDVTGTGTGTTWTIATYTGMLTGTFENITSGYDVTYGGGMIVLNSIGVSLAGDYNDDGKVDAADYVVWRKYQGTTTMLPNDPHGGTIGAMQFNTWKANFGNMEMPGSGGSSGQGAVPEPTSLALLLVGMMFGWARRRT